MERGVLLEVTKMGVPLRGWWDYQYLLGLHNDQGLLGFGSEIKALDPTYVDDFWIKPGYIGTEQSPLGALFRAAKIDHIATITQVNQNTQNALTTLNLNSVPTVPATATNPLDYTIYAADGVTKVGTLLGSLDPNTMVFTIGSGNPDSVLSAINPGAKLRIDNRWSLALLSYHRHQVPKRPGYYAWDQFKEPNGKLLYPQRSIEVGPIIANSATGGGSHTGKIQSKVIVVANLLDVDAYPWHGDWYSSRVRESLGKRYENNFRLWFNDNADHIGPRTARLVQYDGIVQQALRDVSAWAERCVPPAKSSRYDVVDSQISVPKNAAVRQGIQPIVDLSTNGATQITAGQTVTFVAKIQVPPGGGKIVATEWDFFGVGNFTALPFKSTTGMTVEESVTFTYTTPGTYFPALRATSQREGDSRTLFTKVQNLGFVRIVVPYININAQKCIYKLINSRYEEVINH